MQYAEEIAKLSCFLPQTTRAMLLEQSCLLMVVWAGLKRAGACS